MFYLYPLLLCLFPVHEVYAVNFYEHSVRVYLFVCFSFMLFSFLVCGFLSLFIKDLAVVEILYIINFFLLLNAHKLYVHISTDYTYNLLWRKILFVLLYLIGCVAISLMIFNFSTYLHLDFLTKVLFFYSVIVTFFVGIDLYKKHSALMNKPSSNQDMISNDLPDVYHILADSHAGFAHNAYNDDAFRQGLEKRGFCVYYNAKSNYNYTHLSLSSMLNMDYIDKVVPNSEEFCSPSVSWLYYSQNKVFNFFKKLGYQFFVTSDLFFSKILDANDCRFSLLNLKRRKTKNYILFVLYFNSILRLFTPFLYTRTIDEALFEPLSVYKSTFNLRDNQPAYYYLHLIAPHPPAFADENGNPCESLYSKDSLISYHKFVNKKLLGLIDSIKSQMRPNSIILLHSDHSFDDLESEATPFNILLSAYFPEQEFAKTIPQDCTLVNLFRYIINKFFGGSFEILKNKFYRTEHFSHRICEVTKTVNQEHVTNLDIFNDLQKLVFSEKFAKLKPKYKNKRIVLYGAGYYFKTLNKVFDFSGLNIVAVADKKYEDVRTPIFDEELGYNVISPFYINSLNPDIVLISVQQTHLVEQYFNEILFKKLGKRFKYGFLIEWNLNEKISHRIFWDKLFK